MGVIYSIPLCSKDKENPAHPEDANNNQPTMPNLNGVVSTQPTAIANDNADPDAVEAANPPPKATSTPRAGRDLETADEGDGRKYSSSLDGSSEGARRGDDDGGEGDEEPDETTTSDSGLEQSSSDELELGAAVLRRKAAGHVEELDRPFSAAGSAPRSLPVDGDQPPPRPPPPAVEGVSRDDEGFEASANPLAVIPLDNRDTCEEDDYDDDSSAGNEPLERPPEPTVPDERVDSSSSSSSNRSSPEKRPQEDTTAAISDLLSEIVGGDAPYGGSGVVLSAAKAAAAEAAIGGGSFAGAIESERATIR